MHEEALSRGDNVPGLLHRLICARESIMRERVRERIIDGTNARARELFFV